MKLWGKFFLSVFALSLLSYGISGAAGVGVAPISVETNKEFYVEGATILISGYVKDFDISDPMKSFEVSILIHRYGEEVLDLSDSRMRRGPGPV